MSDVATAPVLSPQMARRPPPVPPKLRRATVATAEEGTAQNNTTKLNPSPKVSQTVITTPITPARTVPPTTEHTSTQGVRGSSAAPPDEQQDHITTSAAGSPPTSSSTSRNSNHSTVVSEEGPPSFAIDEISSPTTETQEVTGDLEDSGPKQQPEDAIQEGRDDMLNVEEAGPEVTVENEEKKVSKRDKLAYEILSSERSYVAALNSVINVRCTQSFSFVV